MQIQGSIAQLFSIELIGQYLLLCNKNNYDETITSKEIDRE